MPNSDPVPDCGGSARQSVHARKEPRLAGPCWVRGTRRNKGQSRIITDTDPAAQRSTPAPSGERYEARDKATTRRRTGGERPATRQHKPTHNDSKRQGQRRDPSIAPGREMAMLAFTRQRPRVLLKPCSPQVSEEQQPTSGAAVRGEDRHVAIEDDVAGDRVRSGTRQVPKWLGGRSPILGFGGGRHPIGWNSKTRRPSAASTGWSRSTPSTMRMNQTPSGMPRA